MNARVMRYDQLNTWCTIAPINLFPRQNGRLSPSRLLPRLPHPTGARIDCDDVQIPLKVLHPSGLKC